MYAVRMTRTLTMEDNGSEVQCTVNPKRGMKVTEYRTITVLCEYSLHKT